MGRPNTNKTEFMRYLDEHANACPSLSIELRLYRGTHSKFGFWLRLKHPAAFSKAYDSWWLRRPRLHGSVYRDCLMP